MLFFHISANRRGAPLKPFYYNQIVCCLFDLNAVDALQLLAELQHSCLCIFNRNLICSFLRLVAKILDFLGLWVVGVCVRGLQNLGLVALGFGFIDFGIRICKLLGFRVCEFLVLGFKGSWVSRFSYYNNKIRFIS